MVRGKPSERGRNPISCGIMSISAADIRRKDDGASKMGRAWA
jgi:hypothetical protein